MLKAYKLSVTVTSQSPDGTLHQTVSVDEYSATPAEHITKNMQVAGAIMGAFGAMAAEAQKVLGTAPAKPTRRR